MSDTPLRKQRSQNTTEAKQRFLPDFPNAVRRRANNGHEVREFMQAAVAPIINDFWERDEFRSSSSRYPRPAIAGLGFEAMGVRR